MRHVKFLAIVLMLAPFAMGAELIVDRVNGPYYTPEAAYLACNDYDVVTIKAGNYPSSMWPSLDKGFDYGPGYGTADGVTFRAYKDPMTGLYDNVYTNRKLYIRYRSNMVLEGLNIGSTDPTREDPPQYGVYLRLPGGGNSSSNNTIEYCVFNGCEDRGVYGYGGSDTSARIDYTTIDHCTFMHTRDGDAVRLYVGCFFWTIQNSIFYNNDGYGVYSRNMEDRVYVDNSCFWQNHWNDPNEWDPNTTYYEYSPVNGPPYNTKYAYIGTGCLVDTVQPQFQSEARFSDQMGYLVGGTPASILNGATDGSYMGARPAPEPATMVLLALGGLLAAYRKR
jgi:hypothetical protein